MSNAEKIQIKEKKPIIRIFLCIVFPPIGFFFAIVSLIKSRSNETHKDKFKLFLVLSLIFTFIWNGILSIDSKGSSSKTNIEATTQETLDDNHEQDDLITEAKKLYLEKDYENASKKYKLALSSTYTNGLEYYRYALSIYYTTGYDPKLFYDAIQKMKTYDNDVKYINEAIGIMLENTSSFDYRSAKLEDYSKGDILLISGKIKQDLAPIGMKKSYLMSTELNELFGYLGDDVIITFSENERILEGDVLKLLVSYDKIKKMKLTNGQKVNTPTFSGLYIIETEIN